MASIVACGTAKFGNSGTTVVLFDKPIAGSYHVLTGSDGNNGGALGSVHESFSVIRRNENGFTVQSSNQRCVANVDWAVIK